MPIPDPEPVPEPNPEPSQVIESPDGTRAIWIRGWEHDAFLYDLTSPPAFEPRWLEWDVQDANFLMDEQSGQIMEIHLTRFDGEQSWFDPDGNPLGPNGMIVTQSIVPHKGSSMQTTAVGLKSVHASLKDVSADNLGEMLR